MTDDRVRIFPLGDAALTVEFGTEISVELNRKAIALANHFRQHSFRGLIEAVPAYASTTIFYDLSAVREALPRHPTAYDAVKSLVLARLETLEVKETDVGRMFEVPVRFDRESGLDLAFVSDHSGLSPEAVIDIFTETTYRVFMLGFLPGFAYMGEVDERIAPPRLETPRVRVPRGSVGIAGSQTGVYSVESPGGWQIIGRTDVEMFTPNSDSPSLLIPGDQVRFVALK